MKHTETTTFIHEDKYYIKVSLKILVYVFFQMSKVFPKFYKLIIEPDTRSIVSNLTNVHKLNSRINYARPH